MNLYTIRICPYAQRDQYHKVGLVRAATFKKAIEEALKQKLCPPLLSEHPTYECRGIRTYGLEHLPGEPGTVSTMIVQRVTEACSI